MTSRSAGLLPALRGRLRTHTKTAGRARPRRVRGLLRRGLHQARRNIGLTLIVSALVLYALLIVSPLFRFLD